MKIGALLEPECVLAHICPKNIYIYVFVHTIKRLSFSDIKLSLFCSIYQLKYLQDVVDTDIPTLPSLVRIMNKKDIEERLIIDPISFGKPLRYSLTGHRRLRVSDYRVVYRINSIINKVIIVAIKHRKEIYEDL